MIGKSPRLGAVDNGSVHPGLMRQPSTRLANNLRALFAPGNVAVPGTSLRPSKAVADRNQGYRLRRQDTPMESRFVWVCTSPLLPA